MAIDSDLWPSIISAASGLIGAGLGGYLTIFNERSKEKHLERKSAAYLAVLVAAHLDQFASQCNDVAYDDGTSEGRPAGEDGQHQVTVSAPQFAPLQMEVDWKALPTDLMYAVLSLPQSQTEINQHLSVVQEFYDPPEHPEYFLTRQIEYARLALRASKTAARLRQHAGLPQYKSTVGEWDRDASLDARIKQLEGVAAKRRALDLPVSTIT